MGRYLDYLKYIRPLSNRFVRYYLDPKKPVKLRLSDVLTEDLQGEDYHQLVVDLAVKGYELEWIKGTGKNSFNVGVITPARCTHYALKKTELREKAETLASTEFKDNENKALKILADQVRYLKSNKKAGQKAFDNVEVIQCSYNNYLYGHSLNTIAQALNTAQIPTKRGGTWHKSTVRYLLTNEEYVHRGYIPKDVFQEVQAKLKGSPQT